MIKIESFVLEKPSQTFVNLVLQLLQFYKWTLLLVFFKDFNHSYRTPCLLKIFWSDEPCPPLIDIYPL